MSAGHVEDTTSRRIRRNVSFQTGVRKFGGNFASRFAKAASPTGGSYDTHIHIYIFATQKDEIKIREKYKQL